MRSGRHFDAWHSARKVLLARVQENIFSPNTTKSALLLSVARLLNGFVAASLDLSINSSALLAGIAGIASPSIAKPVSGKIILI